MFTTLIGWWQIYHQTDTKICNNGIFLICNEELLKQANDVLEQSQWFHRNSGKDHITILSSFFYGFNGMNRNFEMFPNLKQCNAILSESGKKKTINDNRISFNAMYIVTGCSETSSIPFKNKTHDTIMVGNLHSRLRKNDRFFQDRRDICDWTQSQNFTLKYSMSVCGKGTQCPALSYSRTGFHVRGDSYGASSLFHTLLSGTVPIFTHKEQYDAHQSFIDWNKLSFFLGFGNKEDGSAQNETSFLYELDNVLGNREVIEEKTKMIVENRDLFDWSTIHPFDKYMYMFQAHIYPETRISQSKYSALISPPPIQFEREGNENNDFNKKH